MKKILIVNLKKFGDIFATGHLIHSLQEKYKGCEISLLAYKESEKASWSIKGVTKTFTIDRKRVLSLKSSPLFCDTHALNEFMAPLLQVKNHKWDMVINISNDSVSTYITSFLDVPHTVGTKFNLNKTTQYNNYWNKIYNDVLTGLHASPFNFVEIYHKMAEAKLLSDGEKAISYHQNNSEVFRKFQEVRNNNQKNSLETKIVGIQLKSADASKDIPKSIICSFIRFTLESKNIVPVLLISKSKEEQDYANSIIKEIGTDLISIESDFKALSSVLMNLDLLITPDTSVKHFADLTYTPMVEVSTGTSPMFKQSTIEDGNIVIRPLNGDQNKLNVIDLIKASHDLLNLDSTGIHYSKGLTIYQVKRSNSSINYLPIGGEINVRSEIERMVSKEAILAFAENSSININNIVNLGIFQPEEFKSWATEMKQEVLEILKSLLTAIRSIGHVKATNKGMNEFLSNLDRLLTHIESKTINSIPINIFRADLESMNSISAQENISLIEAELFKLKARMQVLTAAYSELQDETPYSLSEETQKEIRSEARI